MEKGGYTDEIGAENIYDSKDEAIRGIFERLDRNICANCEKRIFIECQSLEPIKVKSDKE
jgi:SulP family sulfate permease